MYVVAVTFQIKPDRMAAFLLRMQENAHTSLTREPGCQQFDICRNDNEIFLYEVYDDRAAFDAHLASPHFASFDAAVDEMISAKDVRIYEEVMR
ncbi:MAG: putative quinol monooxygenase [Pseudomonadota bacterium]